MCRGIKDCPCNKKYLLNFEDEPFETDTEFDEEVGLFEEFDEEQLDTFLEFGEEPELIELETDTVPESEVKRRSRRVRHFTCSNAERSQIENLLQMSVSTETLRSEVNTLAGTAVSWALSAARALERSPRSNQTKQLFREAFGTSPEFVPSWRLPSYSWKDRGGLVAIRLRSAAKILDEGWIRYFCWGSPAHCPECTGDPSTYYACSSWKRYIICLGEDFWKDWQNRRTVSMISTLLHECFHIYYGHLIGHGERGRYSDANCYVRFVLRFNGQPVPPRIASRCPTP